MTNLAILSTAQSIGASLGVDPALIYGQFVAENGQNMQSQGVSQNNPGNLMPGGTLAAYPNLQTFAQAYISTITKNFPGAIGSGSNPQTFTQGLTNAQGQTYYGNQITPQQYQANIVSGANSVSNSPTITQQNPPATSSTPGILGPAIDWVQKEAVNIMFLILGVGVLFMMLKKQVVQPA